MEPIRGILEEGPALPPNASDDVSVAILRVLSPLSRRQREVAERRLRLQQSSGEIARALGITHRTVERHVRHIAARLRRDLSVELRAVQEPLTFAARIDATR